MATPMKTTIKVSARAMPFAAVRIRIPSTILMEEMLEAVNWFEVCWFL